MWLYTNKDGSKVLIPYSNIDYVILSKGSKTTFNGNRCFDHDGIDKFCDSEFVTIIYKKSGGFIYIEDEIAFNQLVLISDNKFVYNNNK